MRLRQCCATGIMHAPLHLGSPLQTPDHGTASAGLTVPGATVCASQDTRKCAACAGRHVRPLAYGWWAFVVLALYAMARTAVSMDGAGQGRSVAWAQAAPAQWRPRLWMEASLWQLTLAQAREPNRLWAYGRGRPAKKRGMRRQRQPLPDVDGVWTEEALWQLTVAELRAMGRARGLPGMGSSKLIKPGIIARLLEVINK